VNKGRDLDRQDGAHPIDKHVGRRVRLARISKDISQTALAKSLGITFQQVQKYEKGANRVSASRLFEIATFLQVAVSFFFEGAINDAGSAGESKPTEVGLHRVDVEILETLAKIDDRVLKRKLRELIDHLGTPPEKTGEARQR
jgi:transcriptional regulator with XRE-family HTH domain